MDKGFAYELPDGIYYDLSKFKDYGKLSGRTTLQADDAISRIDENREKRNSGDFALWKKSKPGEPTWESPWGPGRPGWHIEDTAITEHFFGPQYDLHGGARDLIFPHHEAEIAQQEAASGKVPFVKYWMHSGFLENKAGKMSKSLGNFLTLHEALEQYEPAVIRFFLLSNHYRAPLEFNDGSFASAQAAVQRIGELARKQGAAPVVDFSLTAIEQAMDDDFNTAAAFAGVFDIIKEANRRQSVPQPAFFEFLTRVFGIVPTAIQDTPLDIQALVDKRQAARDTKDWKTSDAIRDELSALGWTVDDTPYGPLAKRK
jgi:cysteinyl-tRNA synthetase